MDGQPKPHNLYVCKQCRQTQMPQKQKPKEPLNSQIEIKLQVPKIHLDKKFEVKIKPYGEFKQPKVVGFGAVSYDDYILSDGDQQKRQNYIARHFPVESEFWDFVQSNIQYASFWARWLLWGNSKDIFANIKEIEDRLGVKITYNQKAIENRLRTLNRLKQQ